MKHLIIISFLSILLYNCQFDKKQMIDKREEKNSFIKLINDTVIFILEGDTIQSRILNYQTQRASLSKNLQNIAIAEAIKSTNNIEIKSWKWVISLYDLKGVKIGSSMPLELYDSYFHPLGNDSTVIVYNEMGGGFELQILNIKDKNLNITEEKLFNTRFALWDYNFKGNYISYIINDLDMNSSYLELMDINGNVKLKMNFGKIINRLFLSDNATLITLLFEEKDKQYVSFYNLCGNELFKIEISRIGNYKTVLSNDSSDRFTVLYSWNNIYYVDIFNKTLLYNYSEPFDSIHFESIRFISNKIILVKKNHLIYEYPGRIPKIVKTTYLQIDTLGQIEQKENINDL